jgi:hypothetical protein
VIRNFFVCNKDQILAIASIESSISLFFIRVLKDKEGSDYFDKVPILYSIVTTRPRRIENDCFVDAFELWYITVEGEAVRPGYEIIEYNGVRWG